MQRQKTYSKKISISIRYLYYVEHHHYDGIIMMELRDTAESI